MGLRSRRLVALALALTMGISAVVAARAPVPTPDTAPADSADLEAQYQELLSRAEPHRLLLVGEMHGTDATPAVFANLARRMATTQRPLLVGLEIPGDQQPGIDRFLSSAGTATDRARLLAGAFWQRDYQDGRSSVAMLELLESLRALALKAEVTVLAFDVVNSESLEGAQRDQQMAEHIATALEAQPMARGLVLAGNFHTRIQAGAPWNPQHQFMGYRLREFDPLSIEIMGISGSAWICTGAETESCKARPTPKNTLHAGLELSTEINERSHHGVWWLPLAQASPPAKEIGQTPAD